MEPLKNENLKTGLAFSGGGVRSAAFCSGVLRRLLQKRVSIDYLSSVSGGGYVGASYMDWKYRHGKKDDPAWHHEYFENLRRYSNPLCDCFSPFRGTLDCVVLLVALFFLSVVLSLLKAFSFIVPTTFVVDSFFGEILRDQFTCRDDNTNKTVQGIPQRNLIKLCLPKFGPNMETMLQITLPMFMTFVVSYFISTIIRQRTVKYVFSFLYHIAGFSFAMVFLPWFLEMYEYFTPRWANFFIVGVVFIVWIFFHSLRDGAFLVLVILVYAYFVKWTVFKTTLAGVEYTDELYWTLVWVTVALLWVLPYLGVVQMYGAHLFVEWRLTRAYFSPESKLACCWFLCKGKKPITLADLHGMKPEYQSNVTVNNWRKTNQETDNDYEVLTLSPTVIERIDRKRDEAELKSEGFIKPKDIRLSSAMTTSASAISYDDGKLQDANKASREIRIILGLGIGNNLVVQKGLTKNWMSGVMTFLVQLIFGCVIFAIPIATYTSASQDRELWKLVILVALVGYFFLFGLIAIIPISKQGLFALITRWCIINIFNVRILRTLFDVTDVGPIPPPILALSDGGHTENLGLLPLFKRRLQRIVVVNGGDVSYGGNYATDLLITLQQARDKLRCSFGGINGRDIIEDIRDNFVEQEKGEQPRSYRFKVYYYEKDEFENKLVGEGEVLMLMPRHPDDGISQYQNHKWNDFDDDVVKLDLNESAWGEGPALKASEVDRLSGCCCECCHSKHANDILKSFTGAFPFHSTVNQLLTSSQHTAYHREGYHACVEAKASIFLGNEGQDSTSIITSQPKELVTNSTLINVTAI